MSVSNGDTARRSLAQLAIAAFLASAAIGAALLATTHASLEWGIASVLFAAVASLRAISASPSAWRGGLFLPFSFIGLWVVGYGLASLAWRNPGAELLAQNAAHLQQGSVPFGLAISTAGLLAWTAGYGVVNLRLVRVAISALRRWSTSAGGGLRLSDYSVGRIAGVYAVGLGARLVLLAIGRYSYITADLQGAITQSSPLAALLSHAEFLTTVGLYLLAYASFQSGSATAKRLLIAALLLEIPFGLLSGMRSFILLRVLGVAITYVLVRKRVPAFGSIALLGALALLSPFTDAYRSQVRGASGTTVGATGAAHLIPTLLGSTFSDISPRDIVSGPSDFAAKRLRFVDEVAIVGQKTPSEISYIRPTETLLEATTVLIPRALWEGKPVYTGGLQYARDFWNQPEWIVSSRSPTYPGDAYYRGGWLGLVVLMALVGGLMAAINRSLSPGLHPSAIPMFIVAWTGLMNIEGSLSLLSAGLMQSLLITAVAMRWASSAQRGARATSGTAVLTGRRLQP
ncbi:MAG TPA: hypothetical protein VGR26_12925 [Acidimicrobiales bacterium]|nr:hypothetical protein [Acidimicrobiales bacterium]